MCVLTYLRTYNTGGVAFVGFVVVAFVWTVAADVYFLVTGKGDAGAD